LRGGETLWTDIDEMIEDTVEDIVPEFIGEKSHPEEWNIKGLEEMLANKYSLKIKLNEQEGINAASAVEMIIEGLKGLLKKKEEEFGPQMMEYLIKVIMLQSIDTHWKDHLLGMDYLKEGVGLRGYGQKDPVREYQKEGYDMFMDMIQQIKEDTLTKLCLVRVQREEDIEEIQERQRQDYIMSRGEDTPESSTVHRTGDKIGRNDPCPCGSGKKYKKCHGLQAA
jgi:preprotein translocase subunit SecA